VYTSDSLETILSYLSTRVMDAIADGNYARELHHLMAFLAVWEKRPKCLTPIAYQWCSAISEAAGRLERRQIPIVDGFLKHLRGGLRDAALNRLFGWLTITAREFSQVGRHCNSLRLDDTSHPVHGRPQPPTPHDYGSLLCITLEIGFRLVTSSYDQPALHHTSHHDWMFDAVFSSYEDEVIADAVSVWVVAGNRAPPGSCAHYFAKRIEKYMDMAPLPPRLRRVTIQVIQWGTELEASGLETTRLLNCLDVDVDDMEDKRRWVQLLVRVICSPAGLESLSSHYWCLLDKLVSDKWPIGESTIGESTMGGSAIRESSLEVMRSLEKAEDWDKLEVWMVVVWKSLPRYTPRSTMESIEQVTLKLLLQRASASPRFKYLPGDNLFNISPTRAKIQQICDQRQAEQLPLESLPLPYVPIRPTKHLSILMSLFCLLQSIDSPPATRSPSFCGRRHFLKSFIVYTQRRLMCRRLEWVCTIRFWIRV
jgi:hypothetical protein